MCACFFLTPPSLVSGPSLPRCSLLFAAWRDVVLFSLSLFFSCQNFLLFFALLPGGLLQRFNRWLAGGFSSLLPVHLHEKGYGGNSVLLYLSVGWNSLAVGCGMGHGIPLWREGSGTPAWMLVFLAKMAAVGEAQAWVRQWIVVCERWGECRGGMLWLEEAQDQEL